MPHDNKIESVLKIVRNQYDLEKCKADDAIIQAPFGQKHFDEGMQRLTDSKAVSKLAQEGVLMVLIITSVETNVGHVPEWIQCIQVDKVPDWPAHPTYQNRFFKWAIPFLFPNIKTSLYLDSDLVISHKPDKLRRVFELTQEHGFLVTRHIIRKGWLDEYNAILNWEYLDREKLKKQRELFIKDGCPKNGPVYENNFIGRMHNSSLNNLCEEVLNQLNNFSERDQLGLVYACFKHQIKPFALDEGELLYAGFAKSIKYEKVAFVEPWALSKMKRDPLEL